MKYSTADIADLLGTDRSMVADGQISRLLTDSRSLTYPEETLFFALRTATNDGHRYIPDLVARGVKYFVTDHRPEGMDGVSFFVVDDPAAALRRLAADRRSRFDGPVVAVTGSRGKTVVKEWMSALVPEGMRIARSPRSYNSSLGVPLSLWLIEPGVTDMAIIEAGVSEPGEMEQLREIIRPTAVVITNVGAEHDEGFPSRSVKADEKVSLARGASLLVYCADMPDVAEAVERASLPGTRLLGWSADPAAATEAHAIVDAERHTIRVTLGDACVEAPLPAGDAHAVENVSSAVVAMLALGLPSVGMAERIAALDPVDPRLEVINGANRCMLVNDDFTADFGSLLPALDFMQRRLTAGRTSTVIISDLRHDSLTPGELYDAVARLLRTKGVSRVIGVGPELSRHADLFGPEARFFPATEDLLARMTPADFNNELILIKGDRRFGFHRVAEMLEDRRNSTVLEVNLDAIVHNYNFFRSQLRLSTGVVCMLKAAGYGSGSVELAKTLQSQGAAYVAVAVADEGEELRRAGITMPVMVLNPRVANYSALFNNRLEPEVFSFDLLSEIVAEGSKLGVKGFPIHIKLDTGMHRLGFLEADMAALVARLRGQDVVRVRSVFSHLATADCPDMDDYTLEQIHTYERCSKMLADGLGYRPLRHLLNSAGIVRFPEYQFDMVRLGIGLYGEATVAEMSGLRPVSTLRSTVISIKEWPAGTTIGYARRGVLKRRSRIATVPIGYADGLNRRLGNGNASMWIAGHRCPTVGNICMDACMVDVTDAPGCHVGDEVEIFGPHIPVDEIAATLGTITYEVMTGVSDRVKRVYYRE